MKTVKNLAWIGLLILFIASYSCSPKPLPPGHFRLNSVWYEFPPNFVHLKNKAEVEQFAKEKQLTELESTFFTRSLGRMADQSFIEVLVDFETSIDYDMIILQTRGRRVDIDSDNLLELEGQLESMMGRLSIVPGAQLKKVSSTIGSANDMKYFRLDYKYIIDEENDIPTTLYLMTNPVRTTSVMVINFREERNNLEDYVKKTMMY